MAKVKAERAAERKAEARDKAAQLIADAEAEQVRLIKEAKAQAAEIKKHAGVRYGRPPGRNDVSRRNGAPSARSDGAPTSRAQCRDGVRPCPWVGCAYHLYFTVAVKSDRRSVHFGKEPWEIPETCVLDLGERGGMTLDEVGNVLGLTRERVRQIQEKALDVIRARKLISEEAFL